MPSVTGGEGKSVAQAPDRAPVCHVTSRGLPFEPYFGSLRRTLHAPAVGQVPDHPKAPPPAGALTPRAACEAVSVIEYPAVDAAVDAQVEHDRGVVLRGAVDDPVRHELGDHQLEVVKQRA